MKYLFFDDTAIYVNDNFESRGTLLYNNIERVACPYLNKDLFFYRRDSIYDTVYKTTNYNFRDIIKVSNTFPDYIGETFDKHLKIVNNELFLVSDTKVTRLADNFVVGAYSDITFYNGFYYLVKGDNNVYKSQDLQSFEIYKTIAGRNLFKIVHYNDNFYYCLKEKYNYAHIIYEKDNMIHVINGTISDSYGAVRSLYLNVFNGLLIVGASNLYQANMMILEPNGDDFNKYESQFYQLPSFINVNSFNKTINLSCGNKFIEFNTDTKQFNYINLPLDFKVNRGVLSLFKTLKINKTGENFSIKVNVENVKNIETNEYYLDYTDNFTISVKPNLNYKLLDVQSTKGKVVFNENETIINYENDLFYLEDDLQVVTKYALVLKPINVKLPLSLTLTEDFETDYFNNTLIYNNGDLVELHRFKVENGILYGFNQEYFKIYDNGFIDEKMRYLIIREDILKLSEEFFYIINESEKLTNPILNQDITINVGNFEDEIKGNIFILNSGFYFNPENNFKIIIKTNYTINNIETNEGVINYIKDENDNITSSIIVFNNIDNNQIFINVSIGGEQKLKLILYNTDSDVLEMKKVLTNEKVLYGHLENATNIKMPTFIIDIPVVNMMMYNYLFIPSFKRYYFIDDINSITTELTQIITKEDVLTSFKESIENVDCFIKRSSTGYDITLPDEQLPTKNYLDIKEREIENINNGFYNDLSDLEWNFVINVLNFGSTGADKTIVYSQPVFTNVLPFEKDKHYGTGENTIHTLILKNEVDFETVLKVINEHESLKSSLVSAFVFPCNLLNNLDGVNYGGFVNSATHTKGQFITIEKGVPTNIPLETRNGVVIVIESTLMKLSEIKITSDLNYLDMNGKYEFYIPFHGWTNLNPNQILNKDILLTYKIDLQTGQASYFITDETSFNLIESGHCNLSFAQPFSFDNSANLNTQLQNQNINATLNGIGSLLALGGTTGGLGLLAGSLNLVRTATNYVSSMSTLYTQASANVSSGFQGLASPSKARYRISKPVFLYENINDFVDKYGRVVNKIGKIKNYYDYVEASLDDVKIKNATKSEIEEIKTLLNNGVYRSG